MVLILCSVHLCKTYLVLTFPFLMQSIGCLKSGWLDVTPTEAKLSFFAYPSLWKDEEFRPHTADAGCCCSIRFRFSSKKDDVRSSSEEKTNIDRNKSCPLMWLCSSCLPSELRASLSVPG